MSSKQRVVQGHQASDQHGGPPSAKPESPALAATAEEAGSVAAKEALGGVSAKANPTQTPHHQTYWLWVMCLTGVDYFSTLGYQPSIAFEAAGLLAPLATVVLVLVTLFGALPVYSYVASKSPHGQGSIAMLERLMRGWTGKTAVLVLLGFAATDFIITKTLSSADAAEHLMHNPFWEQYRPAFLASWSDDTQRVRITIFLLVLLGGSFMRGFKEVIGLAVVIVGIYLTLNLIVILSGLAYLVAHPDLFIGWYQDVAAGNWHLSHQPILGRGWGVAAAVSLLIFPKLALGLSGFETGVAVMPLVLGDRGDDPASPRGRIRNTRKLLITAACIMSFCLLGSSLVTSTLIQPESLKLGGPAANRALAFIAHGESIRNINPMFGDVFGTIYDVSTIVILWFAGASAMAGLLNLVPQYLPRYGMAPQWATAVRPLVLLFTLISLFVTWWFDADVVAQGGAYATGVLVLITSGCIATVIDKTRAATGPMLTRMPWRYVLITSVFVYTTAANMIERPDGIKIASCFILGIVVSSFVSRIMRSTELRFEKFEFVDEHSRFLWDSLKHLEFPVLVPHRPGRRDLQEKEQSIRDLHRLSPEVPIVYIEAELGDTSEFQQIPLMEVKESEGRFIIAVRRCASIAHVIAAIALELSRYGTPPEIHFGWSDENPLAASASFFIFGEGNVPWMVRELICNNESDVDRQPRVIVG